MRKNSYGQTEVEVEVEIDAFLSFLGYVLRFIGLGFLVNRWRRIKNG